MTNLCAEHGMNVPEVGCPKCLKAQNEQLMDFLRSFISGSTSQDFRPWGRELYRKLYGVSDEPSSIPTPGPAVNWVQCPLGHNYPSWGYCRQCHPDGEPPSFNPLSVPPGVQPVNITVPGSATARGPCPLCGRTDNHTHSAGPFGMS